MVFYTLPFFYFPHHTEIQDNVIAEHASVFEVARNFLSVQIVKHKPCRITQPVEWPAVLIQIGALDLQHIITSVTLPLYNIAFI